MIVQREYQTIIDCLSNIGGVAQFITFACVIFMMFHHEILMEKALLNEAILQNEERDQDITRGSQTGKRVLQADEDIITKANRLYTYKEIMCFKYFCCKKGSKKYQDYEIHCDLIKERLDVRSLIIANANISVLSQALLEPYQLKLISVVQKKKENNMKDSEKLTIDCAMKQLYERHNNVDLDNQKNQIKRKVDLYLFDQLREDSQKGKVYVFDDEPEALPVNRKGATIKISQNL